MALHAETPVRSAKAKVKRNKKVLGRKIAEVEEAEGGFIVNTRVDKPDGPYDPGHKHIATTKKKAVEIITGFLK